MPKRTTSNGRARPQQECSDGAKMLIDQMKEHPEEFKGFAGKFRDLLDTAAEVTRGSPRLMSQRDAVAIMAAAEEHLYEVWLAEEVLTKMMTPKPKESEYQRAYAGQGLTASRAHGTALVNNQHLYSGALQNAQMQRANMSLDRLQMEKYKYDVEQAMEDRAAQYNAAIRRTPK